MVTKSDIKNILFRLERSRFNPEFREDGMIYDKLKEEIKKEYGKKGFEELNKDVIMPEIFEKIHKEYKESCIETVEKLSQKTRY